MKQSASLPPTSEFLKTLTAAAIQAKTLLAAPGASKHLSIKARGLLRAAIASDQHWSSPKEQKLYELLAVAAPKPAARKARAAATN